MMAVSNSAGNLQTRTHQDAFPGRAEALCEGGGNPMTDWQSGLWQTDANADGWHRRTF